MKRIFLFTVFSAILFNFAFSNTAHSQPLCNLGIQCQTDSDCQASTPNIPREGCPVCIGCVNNLCAPKDALCDDGSDCTVDVCDFHTVIPTGGAVIPNGCVYTTIAVDFPPPNDLPIECYICEPTANNVLVDNGVCDRAAGENCSNSPDCQVEGVPCAPPPPPPLNCQPNPNSGPLAPCQDGDRCTQDVCTIVGQTAPIAECSNPEEGCKPDSDGCCPVGCDGPDPATAPTATPCFDLAGAPIPNCDADCWFPQVCGDALVQPPETCDDEANAGDAGISPSGAIVSDAQCRDVGTPGECTYCGDGIIQAVAGEQCEVGLIGSCGSTGEAGECDLTTCQCEQNLCVTGSGNIWTDIRPGCANCSFHPDAVSQGWAKDYSAFILLAGLVGLGLVLCRRYR